MTGSRVSAHTKCGGDDATWTVNFARKELEELNSRAWTRSPSRVWASGAQKDIGIGSGWFWNRRMPHLHLRGFNNLFNLKFQRNLNLPEFNKLLHHPKFAKRLAYNSNVLLSRCSLFYPSVSVPMNAWWGAIYYVSSVLLLGKQSASAAWPACLPSGRLAT